jgi:hypothetical protein
MANIVLRTSPNYKVLTATALLSTSTYDLTLMDDHDGVSAVNVIPNVYDIDLRLGNMAINLFGISELLLGRSTGLGFMVKGTITAISGTRTLVFRAKNTEGGEVNTICGLATATVVGSVGTGFILTPVGSTNWMLITCDTTS